jgi:hypothetical protein
VGFEYTIPVFERAKTVRALDRAATVIRHALRLALGKRVTSSVVQTQSGAELQQAYDPGRKFYLLRLSARHRTHSHNHRLCSLLLCIVFVSCLNVLLLCVMCVTCRLCPIVVLLPPGYNPNAVK